MHDIVFELYLFVIMGAAMLFALLVIYPLFEIFIEKYIWQSKLSVWEILKRMW